MHHINQVISCMQIYNGKHFLLLNYSEMKELNWEFKGVGKEESWGTKGIQLKSHAVNKIKKSSDHYKELSRQKLRSRPHQHVPPTDLCWITAVTWRSCVCVVLSVSDNPRALWVLSPWPVLFPGAMPLRACLWSCPGCIQAVPRDVRTSQILKWPPCFFIP